MVFFVSTLLCLSSVSGAEVFYLDRASGTRIGERELIQRLRGVDAVLIGELHGNVEHHRVQKQIIRMLVDEGRAPQLYFEMLAERQERRYEIYRKTVKTAVVALTSEDHNRARETALEWTSRGWPLWVAYAPLFELADRSDLPVLHADLPGSLMRDIHVYGTLAIPRLLRDQLFPTEQVEELQAISDCLSPLMREAHQLDEGSPAIGGLVIAQLARDAYMALRLSQARGPRILVAGREHVRTDVGVPRHLTARDPKLRILTIAPMVEGREALERGCPDGVGPAPYDIVWKPSP